MKVFMIIGKSLSGKDTLLNNILSDKKFCEENNLKRLVRYTTRKPRPNEKDGETYRFITNDEYESKFKNRTDIITSSFDTEFGVWHYITDISLMEKDTNYITVGDPDTLLKYKDKLKDNLCVIYLMPPDWILMKRFGNRDDNEEYSNKQYQEIHRRFIDDIFRYGQKTNLFINNCDCIFNVSDDYSIPQIEKLMELNMTGSWKSTGMILSNDNLILFDNRYEPDLEKCPSDKEASEGSIYICNRDILIDTTKSVCAYACNRFIMVMDKYKFFSKE